MKYSIIIPLYNKGPFIAATLRSVTRQTVVDFEVVVIDDGSKDDGPATVEEFARQDPRFRWVSQANAGVSVARNRGIAEARGEWVCFLDADDLWSPHVLESYDRLMSGVDVGAVAVGYETVPLEQMKGEVWIPRRSPASVQPERIVDLPRRWLQGTSFFTSSLAVRRDVLLKLEGPFAVGESCGEDMDLFFRVNGLTDIVFMDADLVHYLHVPDRLTLTGHIPGAPPYIQRMLRCPQRGPQAPRHARSIRRYAQEHLVSEARRVLLAGKRVRALQMLMMQGGVRASHRWWYTVFMAMLMPMSGILKRHQRRPIC